MINTKIAAVNEKIWVEFCNQYDQYLEGISYETLYINNCDKLYSLLDAVNYLNYCLMENKSKLLVSIDREKKILFLEKAEY